MDKRRSINEHKNSWLDSDVEAHWDRVSGIYIQENEKVKATHDQRFKESILHLKLNEHSVVLNISSRDCEATDYILAEQSQATVVNAEISQGLMDEAKKIRPFVDQVKIKSYSELPFNDREFNRILSLETLEHVADPIAFLSELHRVSTGDARLVLSCPPLTSECPYRIYTFIFGGHGEGPHRFLRLSEVREMLKKTGWKLIMHKGTVLVPVGPAFLKNWGEKVIGKFQEHSSPNWGSGNFISVKNIEKLERVMRSHLCNRCGSCVGLSGGKIVFTDKTGDYRPKILKDIDEQMVARLWNACSGMEFSFPDYNNHFYEPETAYHQYIGKYRNIYIGHSNDAFIRSNSASGGILTQVLIWLLDTGKIDGAVVLSMSHSAPWLTEPFIATTKDEIMDAAQSKYIISSVNEILPEIDAFKGKLAYVGLPGQVQSIRKLQKAGDPSVMNIEYIFGPFYGNTLHFSSVKSFLKSYGEKDHTQIKNLWFRYGEWPGNMRVEMRNGRIIELPKFHANYLIPFHIMKNSLLCSDLCNEFTDISGGDAWAPVYEERGKGFSMVISRSEKGQMILDQMVEEGLLSLNKIAVNDAITMHSHGYDLKKRGTFIRIRFRKWFGLLTPDYGYEVRGFSFSRYLMEGFISTTFLIAGTRPVRFIAELIPPASLGKLFEKFRKIWKRSTFRIKRENLN